MYESATEMPLPPGPPATITNVPRRLPVARWMANVMSQGSLPGV